MKAMETLEDLAIVLNVDNEVAEEYVIKCYLALRLKPLIGVAGINVNRANNIADFFAHHYEYDEYSLDLLINALYNYINATKHCPSDKLLTDDIETLLDEYGD